MRRAVLCLLLFCVPAIASAYDDFSRGIDANNHGDADSAIRFFSRSIDAGDLAPPYLPSAHLGRARALMHYRRCDVAFADLSDAIRLTPDFVDAYSLRAEANQCLEHNEAALADASTAIRLKPAAGYYFTRARLLWSMGEFARAHADADAAAAQDPGNAYMLLWQLITARHTGALDTAGLASRSAGLIGWPKPLLDLFAGRATPEDVRRSADGDRNKQCEADFYVAEWQLMRAQAGLARRLLETAIGECPRDYIASDAAGRELKRLEG